MHVVEQVYRGMMDLCVSKFKESEGLYVGPNQAGYCLLRSQLLMALHDNASFRQLANEVLSLIKLCVCLKDEGRSCVVALLPFCFSSARQSAAVLTVNRHAMSFSVFSSAVCITWTEHQLLICCQELV